MNRSLSILGETWKDPVGQERPYRSRRDRDPLQSPLRPPPSSLSTTSISKQVFNGDHFASRPSSFSMGARNRVSEQHGYAEHIHQNRTICLHAFSDLSRVSPAAFVFLLKECYIYGTHKATYKFQLLQQQVLQALYNNPQPGPATFVIQCLYVLPLLGPHYSEGFSHLMISSFCRLRKKGKISDLYEAKPLAAKLFLDILSCFIVHEERILVKLFQVFDIELKDIGEALCGSEVNQSHIDVAKEYVGHYIYAFIESQSYMTAVALLERFPTFAYGESGAAFLDKMIQDSDFKAAERWAAIMGKPMICSLIQKYLDMKMLKNSYEVIKKNNLKEEFPDVVHLYKQSLLKKLAEKGCWDVAEVKTNNDTDLLVYLVYLALEAGYTEKVDELCEKYSLNGFIKEPEAGPIDSHYLNLDEIVLEDISWVDEIDGLVHATNFIEECKVIGVDCEWKPNYEKGSTPNKVSIMQVASDKRVFIFDLIKLYADESKTLNDCFKRIFHSPKILKLGYNLQCDLRQLSHSYGDLECFLYYEMLLDIQKLFKERKGGLSELAKKILGAGLNKTRRNSNWEQRPLSQNQIEYAALDAAVLIRIFHHVHSPSHPTDVNEEKPKIEWRSHIVSHMGNTKMHGKRS